MYNSSNTIEQVTVDGVPFMALRLYPAFSVCYKRNSSRFANNFSADHDYIVAISGSAS